MKKIMFNDKFGLTKSVLEGRKTQTRRILNPPMLFERLKTFDGWTKEAISDWKKSCTERLYQAEGEELKRMQDYALSHSTYKVGEKVAIAQSYETITHKADWVKTLLRKDKAGWKNKMFVSADAMPNHIRINKVRLERLQDISEEDCLAEGIGGFFGFDQPRFFNCFDDDPYIYDTAKEAYAVLIEKLYGKHIWASNPYVFVYEFNLLS